MRLLSRWGAGRGAERGCAPADACRGRGRRWRAYRCAPGVDSRDDLLGVQSLPGPSRWWRDPEWPGWRWMRRQPNLPLVQRGSTACACRTAECGAKQRPDARFECKDRAARTVPRWLDHARPRSGRRCRAEQRPDWRLQTMTGTRLDRRAGPGVHPEFAPAVVLAVPDQNRATTPIKVGLGQRSARGSAARRATHDNGCGPAMAVTVLAGWRMTATIPSRSAGPPGSAGLVPRGDPVRNPAWSLAATPAGASNNE